MILAGHEAALDEREEAIRQQERSLPESSLLAYRRTVSSRVKDPDTYAALVYGLGFGLHHLYLGALLCFVLDLITSSVVWISLFLLVMTGAPLPWELMLLSGLYNVADFVYCLIFSQRIVRLSNIRLSESLLGKAMS